jgi:hypothetical protein
VNEYLDMLLPGLTAKVFRTFRASYEFSKHLYDYDFDENPDVMI